MARSLASIASARLFASNATRRIVTAASGAFWRNVPSTMTTGGVIGRGGLLARLTEPGWRRARPDDRAHPSRSRAPGSAVEPDGVAGQWNHYHPRLRCG